MPHTGRSRIQFPMRSLNFSINLIPGVDSASNRNEYRNLPGGKELPMRKADF
jgi:hypothetical protein